MYVRVNCTVKGGGFLVKTNEVQEFKKKHIAKHPADALKDWYVSPYVYGEEAKEHYKSNNNSMAQYSGSAWPSMLYWDLDAKNDLEKARRETIKLVQVLFDLDLTNGLDIYFSGNKGFHVCVKITNRIEKQQLLNIVRKIASKAKLDVDVFDTSVYNVNRLLRMVNTKHQESDLFKVLISPDELLYLDAAEIRGLGNSTRTYKDADLDPSSEIDITEIIEKYGNIPEEVISVSDSELDSNEILNDFTDLLVDNQRRKCIQMLENGEFPAGTRNDAIVRMASYHKHEGKTKEESRDIINKALDIRAEKYDVNPIKAEETEATLDQVFSEKWTGGIFSCRDDVLLRSACSGGGTECTLQRTKVLGKKVLRANELFKNYVIYGNESDEDFPKFGLASLDNNIRIRTKNYSIIAGANGCVDADTEFMTKEGWKKISEWNGEEVLQFHPDTGKADFALPLDYIKLPCEEFYHFETKYGLDQMLSAEHKVLYYSKNNTPQVASMEEVYERHNASSNGFRGKFKLSFEADINSSLDLSNDQIRLMVAVIADGTFNNKTRTCTIRLKKESKKKRLEQLLYLAGIDFSCTKCNGAVQGYHRYVFTAPWREKYYGKHWYTANKEQLQIIADEVLRWDGYKNQFSTCVKESADFTQYVFSATGKRASIYTLDRVGEKRGEYERKSIEYSVIVASSEYTSIAGRTDDRGVVPINRVKSKDGYKYCFTMPSGFLVLRRNNKIFTTGNSGKTSLILKIMQTLNEMKIPHLFFSLDMADTSLFEKLGSIYTNYSMKDIEIAFSKTSRRTDIMREIGELIIKEMPYTYFDFTSTADMKYVQRTINSLNKDLEDPIKMVFVDYTGRLAGTSDSGYANATSNALMANDVAKETNTHIMFIAQVSREHGDHTTPIRTSRAAKESGAWEENATFVITAWRPFGDGIDGEDKYMTMYVAKNRSGKLGEHYFGWNGRKGTIRELTDAELNQFVQDCNDHNKDGPKSVKHLLRNANVKSDKLGKSVNGEDDLPRIGKDPKLEEVKENHSDSRLGKERRSISKRS